MVASKPKPFELFALNREKGITNIGSHPDNDIVVYDPSVLPFHMMLDHRSKPFRVVPLDPQADITVGDVQLFMGEVAEVPDLGQVRFGDYALVPADGDAGTPAVHIRKVTEETADATVAGLALEPVFRLGVVPVQLRESEMILVNVMQPECMVAVDQTAIFPVTVVNGGPIVANFDIEVEGVPEHWVEIYPDKINLNEASTGEVEVHITPPRLSSSQAGRIRILIKVTSTNYPGECGEAIAVLVIHPFYEFEVGSLSPRQVKIPWRKRAGATALPIRNQGNCSARYTVSAQDEENGCRFEFTVGKQVRLANRAEFQIEPDETLSIPIDVTPLKRRLVRLRAKHYNYTVTAQSVDAPSVARSISGILISRPLFGFFSVMFAVCLLLVGIMYVFQPRIYEFEFVTQDNTIELSQPAGANLKFSPFVTDLQIEVASASQPDQVEEVIAVQGRKEYLEVVPKSLGEKNFTLVANNWLSRMFPVVKRLFPGNSDITRTVLVVPPPPEVAVFLVDKEVALEGEPIKVSYSAKNAAYVFLLIEGQDPLRLFPGPAIAAQPGIQKGIRASASVTPIAFQDQPPESLCREQKYGDETIEDVDNEHTLIAGQEDLYLQLLVCNSNPNEDKNKSPEIWVDVISEAILINNFDVVPNAITTGQQATVLWDVSGTGIASIKITPVPGDIELDKNEYKHTGNRQLSFNETTELVLTVISAIDGTVYERKKTVTVSPPAAPPTITYFTATPDEIPLGGDNVVLAWEVVGSFTELYIIPPEGTGRITLTTASGQTGPSDVFVDETSLYTLVAKNGDLASTKVVSITAPEKELVVIDNLKFDMGNEFTVGTALKTDWEFVVTFELMREDELAWEIRPQGTLRCEIGRKVNGEFIANPQWTVENPLDDTETGPRRSGECDFTGGNRVTVYPGNELDPIYNVLSIEYVNDSVYALAEPSEHYFAGKFTVVRNLRVLGGESVPNDFTFGGEPEWDAAFKSEVKWQRTAMLNTEDSFVFPGLTVFNVLYYPIINASLSDTKTFILPPGVYTHDDWEWSGWSYTLTAGQQVWAQPVCVGGSVTVTSTPSWMIRVFTLQPGQEITCTYSYENSPPEWVKIVREQVWLGYNCSNPVIFSSQLNVTQYPMTHTVELKEDDSAAVVPMTGSSVVNCVPLAFGGYAITLDLWSIECHNPEIPWTETDPNPPEITLGSLGSHIAGATLYPQQIDVDLEENQYGATSIQLICTDKGGLESETSIGVSIIPVNDEPDFTAQNPPAVIEDAGPQTIPGWATFDPGPYEVGQAVLTYIIGTNPPCSTMLSAGPVVDPNGTLTYTPAPNQHGDCNFDLQVQDNGGTANGGVDTSVVQNLKITVEADNDDPSGEVTITGLVEEDQTLSADTGTVEDVDGLGSFSYQWQRSSGGVTWNPIPGATASTYTLGDNDVGYLVRVVVSYTDGDGTAESLASLSVGPVSNVNDPGFVSIQGTATEDQVLTANVNDDDGISGVVTYRWERSSDGSTWSNISGATAPTYTLGDGDVGYYLRVRVSYTDDHGTDEHLTSAPIGPVTNVNDSPSGAVTISGNAVVDGTLTAVTSTIADADGLGSFTYQWQRSSGGSTWSDISGATDATYVLTGGDAGRRVRVVVSYIDGHGTPESLTSAPVGPIADT